MTKYVEQFYNHAKKKKKKKVYKQNIDSVGRWQATITYHMPLYKLIALTVNKLPQNQIS